MPRIGVLDLVGERQGLADLRGALDVGTLDVATVLHDLLPELVALVELGEILLDDLPGIFTVERIGPALGKVGLDLAVRDLVFERGGAPAGAPIELQPILDAQGLGLGVVREDAGVGDRIARADEAVIGVLASRIDLLAADHGGGRGRIALWLSGHLAHVAVLAGDAGFACRAVAILIPDDLQLDAEVNGDLVAADAELRLGDLVVRDHALVNVIAAPVSAGFDRVGVLVGDDVLDHALFAAAVDRLVDLARLDPALAVDLAVGLFDPVAGDAAHALARDRATRPERRVARLAELGADLLVAAYAEGADRTLGQFLEFLLELVEHRRDRRIGMLRRRPFFVDLLMAFATLRRCGIEGEVSSSTAGLGASSSFAAFAFALLSWSSLTRASSAACGLVTAPAPSFCAIVFWLDAAFISTALAKTQHSIEILDNFTASPFMFFRAVLDRVPYAQKRSTVMWGSYHDELAACCRN